jgi:hypothetical protein
MFVTLLRAAERDGDLVEFRFDGGHGVATWKGTQGWAANTPVDVELELPSEIHWEAITFDPAPGPLLELRDDGGLRFRAPIEELEENGVLVLRLGAGLLSVETTGAAPAVRRGLEVGFTGWYLELYPTGM